MWSTTWPTPRPFPSKLLWQQRPPPLAWLPISVILVATFTNIAVYGVEWCLYAIYFRSGFRMVERRHRSRTNGWRSPRGSRSRRIDTRLHHPSDQRPAPLHRGVLSTLLRPPLAVAVLLASHGVLMVLLAQPLFGVALIGQVCHPQGRALLLPTTLVPSYSNRRPGPHIPRSPDPVFARRLTSQILLGTVYVFCEQFVQEMLVIYSVGSHIQYKRLVFYHYIFFCGGACACAPIAIGLFELLSFERTFYVSAVWAGVAAACSRPFHVAARGRYVRGHLWHKSRRCRNGVALPTLNALLCASPFSRLMVW